MRLGLLFLYVVVGAVLGLLTARLALIPVALILPVNRAWAAGVSEFGAFIGIVAGVGRWMAQYASRSEGSRVHGSARFASNEEVRASLGRPKGLIVGRENVKKGRLLRYDGPAHLITIAPTRSGKGVGAIIPNLLTADRSILCIDPKGENARISAAARARFGPVYVLDPFEVSGQPRSAFNPLAALDPDSPDLAEDAALLADALVHDAPGQAGDADWNEEAKALITEVILYVVCTASPSKRTLAQVRDLLTSSPAEIAAMLVLMNQSDAAGGLIRRAANRHLGQSDREAAGVLSSAQRHTHFLDSVRINWTMARSDFRYADLKSANEKGVSGTAARRPGHLFPLAAPDGGRGHPRYGQVPCPALFPDPLPAGRICGAGPPGAR